MVPGFAAGQIVAGCRNPDSFPCFRKRASTTLFYREFRWQVPAHFNIGIDVCDRWANTDPGRLAILHVHPDGATQPVSYGWLKDTSNRLANVLAAHGITRGDRVALLLPQTPEVAAIHIAVYKLAAIALPLALLFGTEAISYRLLNSGAKAVITNAQGLAKLAAIRADVPIGMLLSIDGAADGALGFHETVAQASPDFAAQATSADDPAMMVYTSGTTGQPKGAVHGHACCSDTCPGSRPTTNSSRNRATAFGPGPTGHGRAGSSTSCCRACIMECRWWRAGSNGSIPKRRSR